MIYICTTIIRKASRRTLGRAYEVWRNMHIVLSAKQNKYLSNDIKANHNKLNIMFTMSFRSTIKHKLLQVITIYTYLHYIIR